MMKKLLLLSCVVLILQSNHSANAQSDSKEATRPRIQTINKSSNINPLYYDALDSVLAKRKMKIETVCDRKDYVSRRIIEDYGALFMANENVSVPPVCMFTSEQEVLAFQNKASSKSANVGGITIELQATAMDDLLAAREEAKSAGLTITPRGGDAARRSFADTQKLWDSRFIPALNYWKTKGKLTEEDVSRLRSLPIKEQVQEVLKLEEKGIFFNTNFSKSILYSVAAPGTSQHISMLALDVKEYGNSRVREILARHGWFQTVKSDQPHFTYLGVNEATLPSLGLRSVKIGEQVFWIPNIS